MQVTIRSKPQEILVQTVSLTLNRKEPSNVFLFFCPRCGYQISQVQGAIARIFPGLEPSDEIPVIHKCPQCGEKYTFQTKRFLKDEQTKITLSHTNGLFSTFHCVVCRNPELQYNNELITILPTHARATLPLALNCINPQCHQRYLFVDVL